MKCLEDYIAALDRVDDEIDFYLYKYYASGSPSSTRAVLTWVQTNPILFVMIILAIVLVYCLIEWRIDIRKPVPAKTSFYYPVSMAKLFMLTIGTLGFYQIFWFYRNWKYIRQRDDSAIMPFRRAVFIPIWYIPHRIVSIISMRTW